MISPQNRVGTGQKTGLAPALHVGSLVGSDRPGTSRPKNASPAERLERLELAAKCRDLRARASGANRSMWDS